MCGRIQKGATMLGVWLLAERKGAERGVVCIVKLYGDSLKCQAQSP